VVSSIAEVAIGCGAKTVDGHWLKFMCYNLGANITSGSSADPFTFIANDTTILGKFYQWGRSGANHRAAKDSTNFTTCRYYPNDWVIPLGYNKPFDTSYHQNDFLWRHYKENDYSSDPCPTTQWHVPSQSAFGAIFNGTADAEASDDNAIANTWKITGTFQEVSGNGGYAIKPDGVTTTLFFPATGYRQPNTVDGPYSVGLSGIYWSSTTAGTAAFSMAFRNGYVYPAYILNRGFGLSVRCIAEE
jgi:hypothetical protein